MKKLFAGVLGLMLVAGVVRSEMIYEGTYELGFSGLVDFDTADDALVRFDMTWGEFVKDYWEVGVVGGLNVSESLTQFRAGVFTEYNFEIDSTVLPFIGTSLNILAADVDLRDSGGPDGEETAFGLGAEIGLKGFLSDHVALTGSIDFQWASEEVFLEKNGATDTDARLKFGLRFYY